MQKIIIIIQKISLVKLYHVSAAQGTRYTGTRSGAGAVGGSISVLNPLVPSQVLDLQFGGAGPV